VCYRDRGTLFFLHHPREFVFWDRPTQVFGFSAVDGLAGAIIGGLVLAPAHSPVRRLFEGDLFGWFGRYSYGLYVVHFPIMHAFRRIAEGNPRLAADLTTPLGRASFLFVSILASMTVARVSWALIEAPFIRLKQRFPTETARSARRSPLAINR